jgi:hypothetical protein
VRYPKVDTVNSRIAESPQATQKVRLAALEGIGRPALALLVRLLSNPSTPSRLLALAAERYQIEMLRKEMRVRAQKRNS